MKFQDASLSDVRNLGTIHFLANDARSSTLDFALMEQKALGLTPGRRGSVRVSWTTFCTEMMWMEIATWKLKNDGAEFPHNMEQVKEIER
jgi:hypothetical protein